MQEQQAPVLSVKDWMITILLLAIPIVNIVLLFVWAFSKSENPTKSNYAKASLIWAAIGLVIYLVFVVIIFGTMMSSMNT
ncbi:hypothetical protein ACFPES_06740 [Paenibacillus sp. GCM10023248]|uniref:hypothetical protein n=1 Tax=Bacillales TaxID=1385 RepID=UPI002379B3F0|nr:MULTISPECIES: hypothetical protein [Bacillales]MDD9266728.1 hypothetical protein [Paenibacillus sp. MAHUQ-63]MDR6883673.1 heme/copper-type cytochrome/quinol oxidase subunit 2 [Bacillus sp. 3255]